LQNGLLASASWDRTIKIWNADNGSLVRTLAELTNPVLALVVLPNGYLASGSGEMNIKIWNADTGRLIRTLSGHIHFISLYMVVGCVRERLPGQR
jgi:WD40 repeat protein